MGASDEKHHSKGYMIELDEIIYRLKQIRTLDMDSHFVRREDWIEGQEWWKDS